METENFAYDRLAYSNQLFTQTFPDSFATVARLNGLNSPDVETARVLELGCGMGLNLISQAYSLPNAEFIGIDLAEKHIEYANNGVEELGLKNIEFRKVDLMKIDAAEFGKFDYIFGHGLISWVPDFVRDKTLSLYRDLLTENGVGFLSYNTFPGWHFRQVSSEILKIHTRDISEPAEKVGEARNFLKFLGTELVEKDVYNFCIQNEMHSFESLPETSVFHDALASTNNPFYFSEFAKLLAENDLQFLSEVELILRSSQKISDEAQKKIEDIDDIIWKEQYRDFFTGRAFRQTLFCRKELSLQRDQNSKVMDDFFVASSLSAVAEQPEYFSNKVETFSNISGNKVQIDHPLVKTSLKHLREKWGQAIKFSELLEIAKSELTENGFQPNDWDEQFNNAREIFLKFVSYSTLIEIHTHKQNITTKIGEKPTINPLARWQLERGSLILASYRRAVNIEDQVIADMLKQMDGSKTLEEINEKMRDLINADNAIENKDEYFINLSKTFSGYLERLEKAGIFLG